MTIPFPTETYGARLDAVATLLQEKKIDAAVLTPGADLRFLLASDIDTHERFSALVVTPSSRQVIVPAVDAGALRGGVPGDLGIGLLPWTDGQDPLALLLQEIPAGGTVAVSAEMPASHLLAVQDRGLTTVNATAVLRDVFMVKDAIDNVHCRVPELLAVGRTEAEIARDLERLILVDHIAVDFVIVGSGPHGADPHHDFSDRVITDGDIVVIDIGGTLDSGYHSDCTRTYVVGDTPRTDQKSAYQVLAAAQAAGRAAARPGITAHELDAIVRNIIADAGYSEFYTHRTGHGIGLSGHEEPFIIAGNDLQLVEGMVFSIEPGLYFPGKWGARIEDIVVLTADGCEPLNTTTRELLSIGYSKGDE